MLKNYNKAGQKLPVDGKLLMEISSEMIPKCPDDGSDMTMNLRADDSFVEDEGWHRKLQIEVYVLMVILQPYYKSLDRN